MLRKRILLKAYPSLKTIKEKMRLVLFMKFGRVSPNIKPQVLRYFFHELTGDSCASDTSDQAEIDERIRQIIELEDPDITADLRTLNSSTSRAKFDRFWSECEAILNEEVGVAVDDRRHSEVTHLATAISVRDLWERVKQRIPADTEWLRLQFWPKTVHAEKTLHYTVDL